jgi:hypothetical protein
MRTGGADINLSHGAILRRPLAVVALAAGLTVAGCGGNAGNAPGAPPAASSAPATSSGASAQSQQAARAWAASMCQALGPTFSQLGAPPQPNTADPAATRQAYIDYLARASNAAQQAMDRLASVGPPPVQNGQQILDQLRTELSQLRTNLNDATTQLQAANPNDAAAVGQAFGAVGNAVGLVSTLTSDPQLRAAIDQTAECQNVPGINGKTPTTPSQPPS